MAMALLYHGGFHSLQLQRVAHCLWMAGERSAALRIQVDAYHHKFHEKSCMYACMLARLLARLHTSVHLVLALSCTVQESCGSIGYVPSF
jgi:serine acetyltransferase